jgi:hypothetical protein
MVRINVPFTGPGQGVEKLAWGQQELWMAMVRQQSWLPMGGVLPVPAGRSLEDVAEELRYMFSRYEAMRTVLRLNPDGWPSQVVVASGQTGLEVIDAEGVEPAEVAAQLHREYENATYDYETQWPMRMAVVCDKGAPAYMVVVSCHLIADATGYGLLGREVTARPVSPVAGMQSREQAHWQRSPAGVRQTELALRYWENTLRSIPDSQSRALKPPQEPRHWRAEFSSPAAHLAIRNISARTGTDSATILLALYAAGLTRVTGLSPVVIRPVVSNRFRAVLADVVSTVAQSGLMVLDVAGLPFTEALQRVQRLAMPAYKHAYYDPVQVESLVNKYGLDTASFYNDRRLGSREMPAGPVPGQTAVETARGETTLVWTDKRDQPFERLFVHIDDIPDTVRITIFFDTAFLSPQEAEDLLRLMEYLAIEAVI